VETIRVKMKEEEDINVKPCKSDIYKTNAK
jgi:hypothetical protein